MNTERGIAGLALTIGAWVGTDLDYAAMDDSVITPEIKDDAIVAEIEGRNA